ncbi:class I adenylate-forming enzyme family protein [Megalodesulfovibrio gigas]|nr:fatty acid--CoA ligase family protein [Megalodesulfovibrio gigas]
MIPFPWPSFPALVAEYAARTPQRPAVFHPLRTMTYAELAQEAAAAAHLLQDMGVRHGDRVGCLVRKTPEAIAAYLGIQALGAIFFPLDANQPPAVLRDLLTRLSPRAVVLCASHAGLWDTLGAPHLPRLVLPHPDHELPTPHTAPCCRFWTELEGVRLPMPLPPDDDDTPVYMNFTSGSTGRPKGALTTLGNIHWNSLASVEHFRMTGDDVHLCMMPSFVHPHELFARPLAQGGALALMDGIDPRTIVDTIRRFNVTCFMAVAAIYETLIRQHEHAPFDLESLRVAESGGMHVPAALSREFRNRLGVRLLPVWGSTETTGIAMATPLEEDPSFPAGATGRPLPQYLVEILDEHGEPVRDGAVGELHVSGPGVCREYYHMPLESAESFVIRPDGTARFRTRDLVSRTPDGAVMFHSRMQGMLKVAGMKVYPTRIEELLHEHPAVAQAVVVRMHDPLRGEAPRAVVALRPGQEATPRELWRWLEARLHRFALPRVIDIVDAIPKTPGGKIAWKEL